MATDIESAAGILSDLCGSVQVLKPATLCVDNKKVPYEGGVVRFRKDDGYNDSFALQWKAFQLTQYDDRNGVIASRLWWMLR